MLSLSLNTLESQHHFTELLLHCIFFIAPFILDCTFPLHPGCFSIPLCPCSVCSTNFWLHHFKIPGLLLHSITSLLYCSIHFCHTISSYLGLGCTISMLLLQFQCPRSVAPFIFVCMISTYVGCCIISPCLGCCTISAYPGCWSILFFF